MDLQAHLAALYEEVENLQAALLRVSNEAERIGIRQQIGGTRAEIGGIRQELAAQQQLRAYVPAPPRQFFPVMKPVNWDEAIDHRLETNQAARVSVFGSAYPNINEGVLFNENFVTEAHHQSMATELLRRIDELQLQFRAHSRGQRQFAKLPICQVFCPLCNEESNGYRCQICNQGVCTKCCSMAFIDSTSELPNPDDGTIITVRCPYCKGNFQQFQQNSFHFIESI